MKVCKRKSIIAVSEGKLRLIIKYLFIKWCTTGIQGERILPVWTFTGLPDRAINRKWATWKMILRIKNEIWVWSQIGWLGPWKIANWALSRRSAENLFRHAVVLKLQVPFLQKNQHKLEIHSCDINIHESTLVMASIEKILYPYFFLLFIKGCDSERWIICFM